MKSFRFLNLDLALCIALMFLVVASWLGFTSFLQRSSSESAGFRFMVRHLSLGETPEFVLNIAGEGLAQPLEIIATRKEFQAASIITTLHLFGLVWLSLRVMS